jgi:hypothetical protein
MSEDPATAEHRADGALGPDADGEALVLDLLIALITL